MRVPAVDETSLRKRAAQFGWLTVALGALAIALLAVAAWVVTAHDHEPQPDEVFLTRATALYWGQQLGLAYGVLALQSYLLLMTISLLAADSLRWSPFWVSIGLVFLLERLVTVGRVGRRGRALAVPVIPELAYAVFLQACSVTSIAQILVGRKAGWNYVPRPAASALLTPWMGLWLLTAWGILLPSWILQTGWYEALALWVGFNTLVFVGLGLLQLLPPLHRPRRDGTRVAARSPRLGRCGGDEPP